MSFFACKCVFYRPEHNAKGNPMEPNFGDLEIQKWNIPMDRARGLNVKNKFCCLDIIDRFLYSQCYSHWNVKNCSVFVFAADGSKTSVTQFGQNVYYF